MKESAHEKGMPSTLCLTFQVRSERLDMFQICNQAVDISNNNTKKNQRMQQH
jgi:hypothetical protein